MRKLPRATRIGFSKTLFGSEQYHPELRVAHSPLRANVFFFFTFQIKLPKNDSIPLGQFRQSLVDSFPHFVNFCVRSDARVLNRNVWIRQRLPARTAPILQDHIAANPIDKRPELLWIVTDLVLLRGFDEARQRLLHHVFHVRTSMSKVIKNFIAQLQAQPLKRRLTQINRMRR